MDKVINEKINERVLSKSEKAKKLMPILLFLFVLTNLMVQTFVTVSPIVAEHFFISASTVSIIVTITTITLGVCSVIYGALSDFISIKKILITGIIMLVSGSLLGFIFQDSFIMIVISRAIQTAGQGSISAMYLVIASRYLEGITKIKYFAYFTACFQLAQALGVVVGGKLTEYVSWQGLLLIPLISIISLPIIIKYTPESDIKEKKKIDFVGLIIFSIFIIFITLYLNSENIKILLCTICSLIIFIIYISKNDNAFITPKFFKENKKYMRALSIVWIVYFAQFSFSFLYTFIIKDGYNESLGMVSLILLPGYIAATIIGGVGDKIINKIGSYNTIFIGIVSIIISILGTVFFIDKGTLVLSILGILYFVGFNTIYSPLINAVTGALPEKEMGRGIGLNDLSINVTGSIGVAITGKIVSMTSLPAAIVISKNTNFVTYQYAALLLALFSIASIIVLIRNRKKLFNQ